MHVHIVVRKLASLGSIQAVQMHVFILKKNFFIFHQAHCNYHEMSEIWFHGVKASGRLKKSVS